MKDDQTAHLPSNLEDLVLGQWQPHPELDEAQAANIHRMARLLAREHGLVEPDSLLMRVWLECLESVDWGDRKRVNEHYQRAVHRQVFFNVLHRVAPQVEKDLLWSDHNDASYVPCMAADMVSRHHSGIQPLKQEAAVLLEKGLGVHVEAWQRRWSLSDRWCCEAAMSSLASAGSILRDSMVPLGQLHIGVKDMLETPGTDVSVLGYMLTIDSRDYDPATQSEAKYLRQKLNDKAVMSSLTDQLKRRNRIAGTTSVSGKTSHSKKFENLIRVVVLGESASDVASTRVRMAADAEPIRDVDEDLRSQIVKDNRKYADEIGLTP